MKILSVGSTLSPKIKLWRHYLEDPELLIEIGIHCVNPVNQRELASILPMWLGLSMFPPPNPS